jgi:hypothetical protein
MFRIFDQYVSRQSLFLVFGDSVAITTSIVLAYFIRLGDDPESFAFYVQQPDITFRGLTIVTLFQICAYYNEISFSDCHKPLASPASCWRPSTTPSLS